MGSGTVNSRNIKADNLTLSWANAEEREKSLEALYEYVDKEATSARDWYLRKKETKKNLSSGLRFLAIGFSATAGLLPIVMALWPKGMETWAWLVYIKPAQPELLTSFAVGLAAALVSADSFAGFSTGWIRYIKCAMAIDRSLHEFRLEWASQMAKARLAAPPITAVAAAAGAEGGPAAVPQDAAVLDTAEIEGLISTARRFLISIQDCVSTETAEWAGEFQSNLSKLEKEAKTEMSARDKQAKETLQDLQPGHLFISIKNSRQLDDGKFHVALTSSAGKIMEEADRAGEDAYVRMGLSPGTYNFTLSGLRKGLPYATHRLVTIKPNEQTEGSIEIPAA